MINDEGMQSGIDIDFYKRHGKQITVPLIISGGIGSVDEVAKVFIELNPSAIGISSLFAFTELTPKDLKLTLSEKGIPIRK